jgi:hypothetical protein
MGLCTNQQEHSVLCQRLQQLVALVQMRLELQVLQQGHRLVAVRLPSCLGVLPQERFRCGE